MPQPLGNGRPGLAGSLGLAPTAALEMSFRLGDHFSVGGLIGAGLGTGEACRNAAVSRSCQVPLLGLFGGFVRYHSVPARGFEPWVAAGLASSALRGPGLGPDVRPQTSVGRGSLERVSATELGVELSLGAGTSWRVSPTVGVGLALNALAGPNVHARETRTYSQGAEDTRSLPLSGVHGIFFVALQLQFHTPN